MRKASKTAAAVLFLATIGLAGGCASTSDLEALQEEVRRVNETANRAAADAASAKQDAAAARAAAEEARDTANETSEKLDRMFKKSMYK